MITSVTLLALDFISTQIYALEEEIHAERETIIPNLILTR